MPNNNPNNAPASNDAALRQSVRDLLKTADPSQLQTILQQETAASKQQTLVSSVPAAPNDLKAADWTALNTFLFDKAPALPIDQALAAVNVAIASGTQQDFWKNLLVLCKSVVNASQ